MRKQPKTSRKSKSTTLRLIMINLLVGKLRVTTKKTKDASFLLTIEVFLLTVRRFYLLWGNREQKRPNPISGRGGIVSKKDQTNFPPWAKKTKPNLNHKYETPSQFSVSNKDQLQVKRPTRKLKRPPLRLIMINLRVPLGHAPQFQKDTPQFNAILTAKQRRTNFSRKAQHGLRCLHAQSQTASQPIYGHIFCKSKPWPPTERSTSHLPIAMHFEITVL